MNTPLTVSHDEMVLDRAIRDPAFRRALLLGALEELLSGDRSVALSCLRTVIKASPGFPAVAEATGIHDKSLIRMLGPKGNPTTASLARIFRVLADHYNVDFVVKTTPRKKTKATAKAA